MRPAACCLVFLLVGCGDGAGFIRTVVSNAMTDEVMLTLSHSEDGGDQWTSDEIFVVVSHNARVGGEALVSPGVATMFEIDITIMSEYCIEAIGDLPSCGHKWLQGPYRYDKSESPVLKFNLHQNGSGEFLISTELDGILLVE